MLQVLKWTLIKYEVLEYEIKDIDTLESISKQYNQSIEEIVNFHNQNCGITQQIIGDTFPMYLKFLYLNTSPSIKSDQEEQILKEKALQDIVVNSL